MCLSSDMLIKSGSLLPRSVNSTILKVYLRLVEDKAADHKYEYCDDHKYEEHHSPGVVGDDSFERGESVVQIL